MLHFRGIMPLPMLFSLLIGIAVGFVLAIPPGPIGVSVIKIALNNDKKGGILIGIGASLMDVFYCLIAMLFTTAVFGSLQYFFDTYPFAMLLFQGFCVAAMFIFGLLQFKTPKYSSESSDMANNAAISPLKRIMDRLKQGGPFFLGIAIALANIANPTFLPSLAYTCMFVQHSNMIAISSLDSILFSLGFGIGNFAWMYLLLRLLLHFKARFSAEFTLRIQRFAGLTMIGVGTYLGYRVILFTKWPEILRFIF
ncbi:MAG: LysE family translocator [Ignavibacteria bacterium]